MSNLLENADVSNSQFPNYLGFKLLSGKNSSLEDFVESNKTTSNTAFFYSFFSCFLRINAEF